MKIIRISLGLALASLLFNGCTEDFDELNTQPDAILASKVDASLLGQAFANSQGRALYGAPGGGTAGFQTAQSLFADLYSQYFATTATNFDSDRHTQVGNWSNGAWTYFYQQAAPTIKLVEDFTVENDMPVENAVNKVWKVEAYHRITDYWGPIVYSEFGSGKTSVAYDPQETVYRDFFVKLDEAVAVLKANAGGTAFLGHDQLYPGSGNVDKWLKFANSLRLRLAMRVKYADNDLAKQEAEKAVLAGVFQNNDEHAMLMTTTTSRNPYWIITDWGEFRMSALMESVLVGYADPRLDDYFSPTANYTANGTGQPYEGLRNGILKKDLNQVALNAAHSDMGKAFLNQGRGGSAAGPPLRVLSAAEVFFLRAEGALEGWAMGGTAEELYNKGIEMSLKEPRIAATDGEVAAYISSTNTPVAPNDVTPASSNIPVKFLTAGTKEEQLEQIITQKWLALYPDGWEAWAELRRTKYPRTIARVASDNTDVPANQTMSRLVFVTGEYSANKVAVEAAAQLPEMAAGGGDKNSTQVWWDAKP